MKRLFRWLYHDESGAVSALDMLLYIGVIAILSVGVVGTYNTIFGQADASTLKNGARTMANNIHRLFGNDYSDLSNSLACQNDLVPTSFSCDGSNIYNGVGGEINLTPTTPSDRRFSIEYTGLTQDLCVQAGSMQKEWDEVIINGTSFQKSADEVPVTVGNASAECNSGAANTVAFVSF